MRETAALDFVLIVVVYLSLTSGPDTGVVAGSVAGLIQDALSSGIMGIGALAKTLVGFAAGRRGHAVHRHRPAAALRRVHRRHASCTRRCSWGCTCCWVCGSSPPPTPTWPGRPSGNAVVGVVGFQVLEWLPGFLARRRMGRPLRR